MSTISRWVVGLSVVLVAATWSAMWAGHQAKEGGRLPEIGSAPEFTLTSQDGKRVSMTDLRGKVVVVTFIYASCPDVCLSLRRKRHRAVVCAVLARDDVIATLTNDA